MSEWQQGFGIGILWCTVFYLAAWWCIWRPRINEAVRSQMAVMAKLTEVTCKLANANKELTVWREDRRPGGEL